MKLHWGHRIAIFIALFMAGMLSLVAYTFRFNNDLVTEHYYDAEIQYQQHIDKVDQTAQLATPAIIAMTDRGVEIRFPPEHRGLPLTGTITLYRPDDKRLDQQVAVGPDSTGIQLVPSALLQPGVWRVKVAWTTIGREYYAEARLTAPR